MKVASFLSIAALATGILAEPIREPAVVERGISTITSVFARIGDVVDQSISDVQSFSGGNGGQLTTDSANLLSAIKSGISEISSSSSITTSQALQLQPVARKLQKQMNALVNDLIAKKSAIIAAGFGHGTYQYLANLKAASETLAKATTSKVPRSLQAIAGQMSGGIAKELQKGVNAFKGAPAGGKPSPPSSTPSSKPSATPTYPPTYPSTHPPTYPTTHHPTYPTTHHPTYPTGPAPSAPSGTGGYNPTPHGHSPIPHNAGALHGVSGAVGVLAVLAAAIGM